MDVCIKAVTFLFPLRHQNILRVSKVEACDRVTNVGWTRRAKPDCSKGTAASKAKEDILLLFYKLTFTLCLVNQHSVSVQCLALLFLKYIRDKKDNAVLVFMLANFLHDVHV